LNRGGKMELENLKKITYGRWIKQAREAKGWSKKLLAEKCGINEGYLARIEGGNAVPSDELSEKLGIKLHLDKENKDKFFLYSHLLSIHPLFRKHFLNFQKHRSQNRICISYS